MKVSRAAALTASGEGDHELITGLVVCVMVQHIRIEKQRTQGVDREKPRIGVHDTVQKGAHACPAFDSALVPAKSSHQSVPRMHGRPGG